MTRIRVLVADDSPTARQLLAALVSADPALEVAGLARSGGEAVTLARELRPDVAVLDIHMPGIDGVEATRRIMTETPLPVVIVSASVDVRDLRIAFEAERAGAAAAQPKPVGPGSADFERTAAQLVLTIKLMAGLKVVRRVAPYTGPLPVTGAPHAALPRAPREVRTLDAARLQIAAIACSTGGPAALARIAGQLPADFPVPIVCVQHVSHGWAAGLATWLDGLSRLSVKLAAHGDRLRPATLYIAPDDHHLVIGGRELARLTQDPAVGGFRPSATPLLDSVARWYGRDALGIVLTGMGDDGAAGMRALHAAGGFCVAQDRESSVVWGMPGSVVESGTADAVRSLDDIIALLDGVAADRRRTSG